MGKYIAKIDIADKELDAIMENLDKARELIYECYSKLRELGITVKKDTTSDN